MLLHRVLAANVKASDVSAWPILLKTRLGAQVVEEKYMFDLLPH